MNELLGTGGSGLWPDYVRLLARLGVDLGFAAIVVLAVHYRRYRDRPLVFTYLSFNLITFALCILLRRQSVELGFALGLFAVFGILRYRTQEIRIHDLTYLFIMIALGLLNGVANHQVGPLELLTVNGLIAGASAGLELGRSARRHGTMPMLFGDLELLRADRHDALIAALVQQTGLDVVRVEVLRIDLVLDAAELRIIHRGPRPGAPVPLPLPQPSRVSARMLAVAAGELGPTAP